MSLPQSLKSARMSNSTVGDQIDNEVGNLEKALCDILGITIDVNVTAALFLVKTDGSGLLKIFLKDNAADPGAAGEFCRNAGLLKFHDGSAVQTIATLANFAAPSNAQGTRRIQSTAPADGDYANGDITFVV